LLLGDGPGDALGAIRIDVGQCGGDSGQALFPPPFVLK
jgi:hypothetical protein